jgi:hypothetical protein
MPNSDPFWAACARHQVRVTARQPVSLYLCDECTLELVSDCLNGRPPIYNGPIEKGYCALCNERKVLAQRQWFICGICANVVRAYGKSRAASRFVTSFWIRSVVSANPTLLLEETDAVRLEPYVIGRRSVRSKLLTVPVLDFMVMETIDTGRRPIALIEMKTGPGAIDQMKEFQLDENDFDDISAAAVSSGLPTYVVHVQVGTEVVPPTVRALAMNMWWTDLLTLRRNLLRTGKRRDEAKKAGYFNPAAFWSGETLSAEFANGRHVSLGERIRVEGVQSLA